MTKINVTGTTTTAIATLTTRKRGVTRLTRFASAL